MKLEEMVVKQFLDSLNLGEVIFEPDGNCPPDFSIQISGITIGIEVRRLNQAVKVGGDEKGEEEISIPIVDLTKKIIEGFSKKSLAETYGVGIEIDRAVLPSRDLRREIRRALNDFIQSPTTVPQEIKVNENISLHVHPIGKVSKGPFVYSGLINHDAEERIGQLYRQNISRCIKEKSQKIMPFHDCYNKWWLFLVDYISIWHGLSTNEQKQVMKSIANLGQFHALWMISADGQLLLHPKSKKK